MLLYVQSEDEEKKCCEQRSGERTYDQEDDKHKVLFLAKHRSKFSKTNTKHLLYSSHHHHRSLSVFKCKKVEPINLG